MDNSELDPRHPVPGELALVPWGSKATLHPSPTSRPKVAFAVHGPALVLVVARLLAPSRSSGWDDVLVLAPGGRLGWTYTVPHDPGRLAAVRWARRTSSS